MKWIGVQVPDAVRQRVTSNYTQAPSGCWVTNYAKRQDGYAVISLKFDGKRHNYLAHRAAWSAANGDIPPGLVIDHMCFNRACVNPAHLRAIPLAENTRRRNGAAFPLGQCRWGHPLSEQREMNRLGRIQRTCGTCMDESNRRFSEMQTNIRVMERHYGILLTREQRAMVNVFMEATDV